MSELTGIAARLFSGEEMSRTQNPQSMPSGFVWYQSANVQET
jgi:hypothetical protein